MTHPGGLLPGLKYRDGGTAAFTSAAPPASSALPGANDVTAAGDAASGTPGGATLLAAANSGIWRSTDSGTTWQRVLSGIQAWSITPVPGGYAALGVVPGPDAPALTQGVRTPELATSTDGVHWHVTKAAEPSAAVTFGYGYRLALTGIGADATGIAVPDGGAFWPGAQPAYRTVDGGRHWTLLTVPGTGSADAADGGIAMVPGGRTVFITAAGQGASCQGAVYESRDGGATWTRLNSSCQAYPLLGVQFTSDLDGFAVGGLTPKFGGGQVVEATTDGGQTWHVIYRTQSFPAGPSTSGFLRIDMLGSGTGWAVAGGCTTGQNGPCGGVVYVTTDGGAQWQATRQQAISVAALGSGSAVAVDQASAAVTSDDGKTWAAQTRPETVTTQQFAGAGAYQLWISSVISAASTDGGQRWSPTPALPPAVTGLLMQAAPPSALLAYGTGGSQTWVSSDGGGNWTESTVPGGDKSPVQDAALGGDGTAYAVSGPGADCLSPARLKETETLKPGWKPPTGASVLYASSDGGARWDTSGVVLPFGVMGNAGEMAASGTRIAIIDACGRLELSADAGGHWTAQSLGSSTLCTVSALGSELWLYCQVVSGTSTGTAWSLHSADGGATWLAYQLPAQASGAQTIVASGPDSAVMPVGGALWHTTDGGRSWAESWPLPASGAPR